MRFAVIVLLPLAAGHPAWAAGADSCFFGNGSVTKQVAGFQTKISPYHHKDFPHEGCRAVVRDQNRKVVFSEHDFGFSIALLGEDVNGDGVPDVVLEAYSGGAHCCWTYYIISLGQKPGLLKAFGNQLGTRFAHNEKKSPPGMAPLIPSMDCAIHAVPFLKSTFASTAQPSWTSACSM
jgi:hypothetical protein